MESPPFPTLAAGWRIDPTGIAHPRGYIPWADVDELVQVEDGDDVTHVQVVLRNGNAVRIPGLSTTFAGLIKERQEQLDALNATYVTQRQPSVLTFPVVLRTTRLHRTLSTLAAAVLGTLAVVSVVVVVTSGELREVPMVALLIVVSAMLSAWASALLLHQGWQKATITVNDVVVRSPFTLRRVPLAKVFAFQHHNRHVGQRSCGALFGRDEPGRRWGRLALPGPDPEYRLPALDAYAKGLRTQAPR